MVDFWNHGWFVLQLAWTKARYEVVGNLTLVVTIATVLLLLWIFFSPVVRNRGQ